MTGIMHLIDYLSFGIAGTLCLVTFLISCIGIWIVTGKRVGIRHYRRPWPPPPARDVPTDPAAEEENDFAGVYAVDIPPTIVARYPVCVALDSVPIRGPAGTRSPRRPIRRRRT